MLEGASMSTVTRTAMKTAANSSYKFASKQAEAEAVQHLALKDTATTLTVRSHVNSK